MKLWNGSTDVKKNWIIFVLEKGEGNRRKIRQDEKELVEWVETTERWPRAPVSGGSLIRKFRNTIEHEARSVDNKRRLRKRHVEVSATNQKLGRQSMETREGTEVGRSKMGRRGTVWQFVPHLTTVGNGNRTGCGGWKCVSGFPGVFLFWLPFRDDFCCEMKNKNQGILDMQRKWAVNRGVEPRWWCTYQDDCAFENGLVYIKKWIAGAVVGTRTPSKSKTGGAPGRAMERKG